MPEPLSAQQFLSRLAKGEPGPLYYLWGEEEFLCERVVTAVRQRVLTAGRSEFNDDRFDAALEAPETILEAARTVPFLGGQRFVLVEGVEALQRAEPFHAYCQAPYPETCLVFTARSAPKKPVHDLLMRTAQVVTCKRLSGRSLRKWVEDEAKRLGLTLQAEAGEALIELVGDDLRALHSELVKLQTFAAERRAALSAEQVIRLVGDTRAAKMFEFSDAVVEGRLPTALRLLAKLLQAHESVPGIVAVLARHYRMLWRVRELQRLRTAPAGLAEKLGVAGFLAARYAQQAGAYSRGHLRCSLLRLFEADQAVKLSGLPDQLTLEKLVLELALPTRQGEADGRARSEARSGEPRAARPPTHAS